MKTNKEKAEYAKWYYYEVKLKNGHQSDYYNGYSKEFAREKTRKRKKYKHSDILLSDEIIKHWRLTGEVIIPDEKIKLEIEKEILKEELIDTDDVSYITLDECLLPEEDLPGEEELFD